MSAWTPLLPLNTGSNVPVIGLNLCPFAKAVHQKQQIRWVESPARDAQGVLEDLTRELRLLAAANPDRGRHDSADPSACTQ
jgi:hypothetical protein